MKKIIVSSLLVTSALFMTNQFKVNVIPQDNNFVFKNTMAITLGYDKSMSEKVIKAAIIDSYFREICQNGRIVRWNKTSMPLKVYISDSKSLPEYYREVVMSAYQAWQRASEGLVRFEFVESPDGADMKCYFKQTNNQNSIGVHAFSVSGNTITDSVIIFNPADQKGHSLDSKQLFSSALQEIGHSLGLTGKSPSIYDVMYPVGTKFNTEITPRDLKTLSLLYSVVPDITNKSISQEQKAQLFTVSELLSTLNGQSKPENNSQNVATSSDVAMHLNMAEQYRRRAEYDNAAKEYQYVAQTKNNPRSRSEVYYEIAVTYLDAEEYDNARSWAEIACKTDMNDLTMTLPALIDYYTKRSTSAVDMLEQMLKENPYNKHAFKLLCQIYRDKHHENMLNSTIRRYGKTAGTIEE